MAHKPGEPMEACLISVALYAGAGPKRFVRQSEVTADTGFEFPDPPLTMDEMQPVAYAAKMAVAKVLRARLRKPPPAATGPGR